MNIYQSVTHYRLSAIVSQVVRKLGDFTGGSYAMVTHKSSRRRKASLHISLDADLSRRLRMVSEKMSIPLSHLSSLALSRAVSAFEAELGIKREDVVGENS
jgi:hypothetical protein